MGLSLSVLLAPTTAEQAEQDVLDALTTMGFPASSWQVKSVPRTLVKWFSKKYSSVTTTIFNITSGGYLSTAADLKNEDGTDDVDWLDLYAKGAYDNLRTAATSTVGTMRVSNSTGAPVAVAVGQLWSQDVASRKYRFTNQTNGGGSIAAGGFLDLTFKSEGPGAGYNLPNNAALELATPIPGVTVTNPAVGATGTWITSPGGDIETNASLATRSQGKWATLGTGGAAPAYFAWAQAGAPTVTKVLVDDANPDGPGTVRVYLANSAGPATLAEVTAANAYIQPKRGITARVTVLAATAKVIVVTATVEILAAYKATAAGQASANLTAYAAALAIGEDVPLSEIFAALSSPTGVRKVTITAPAGETVVAPSEIVTFTLNLTVIYV